MFQTKGAKKIKTHILSLITSPPPENRGVYEIIWKNIVESDRPQVAIWRMRTACWITRATKVH